MSMEKLRKLRKQLWARGMERMCQEYKKRAEHYWQKAGKLSGEAKERALLRAQAYGNIYTAIAMDPQLKEYYE